jgi:predicted ester cyclase
VAVRWSADLTHLGDDLGIPATNRKAHVTGMTMVRFKNGKVISGWDNWDQLALMRQLGVVPEEKHSELSLSDPEKSQGQAGS